MICKRRLRTFVLFSCLLCLILFLIGYFFIRFTSTGKAIRVVASVGVSHFRLKHMMDHDGLLRVSREMIASNETGNCSYIWVDGEPVGVEVPKQVVALSPNNVLLRPDSVSLEWAYPEFPWLGAWGLVYLAKHEDTPERKKDMRSELHEGFPSVQVVTETLQRGVLFYTLEH